MTVVLGCKLCTLCGNALSVRAFGPDARNRDGLRSRCRECERGAAVLCHCERKLLGTLPASFPPKSRPERTSPDVLVVEKGCTKCHTLCPAGLFGTDLRNRDGLKSHCNPCNSQDARRYHQNTRVRRGFHILSSMSGLL